VLTSFHSNRTDICLLYQLVGCHGLHMHVTAFDSVSMLFCNICMPISSSQTLHSRNGLISIRDAFQGSIAPPRLCADARKTARFYNYRIQRYQWLHLGAMVPWDTLNTTNCKEWGHGFGLVINPKYSTVQQKHQIDFAIIMSSRDIYSKCAPWKNSLWVSQTE
jgi:hypothetical protein